MILLKSDIISKLKEIFPYHKREDLNDVLAIIMSSMENSLKNGEKIEIRGFGTFEIKNQIMKEFVNPKTNKTSKSTKKKKIYFKPSSKLKNL